MLGSSHVVRGTPPASYVPDGGMGDRGGGGTYTAQSVEPTIEAYENIFGPSARDIKTDLQRFKRHGRWHLPDILKGPNQYLTDRVDGLITDATNSPFTGRILPYKYITNVDGKIKWNVWAFDEGLASRVPYESAARTLTQTKRSFAGYTVRQGMGINLEHNFMMTEAGRENFRNQLQQLIGSIQKTNDLDVHIALVLAPSYARTMREKYIADDRTPMQVCREFVDLFGFVQKNTNAMDILIEEAKTILSTWGGPMPDFLLCNSKLTFQLTMTPDVTNYVANGPEGPKRLRSGPNLQSYRGINIIHSRAFEMETGTPPRDILRRRVRVAEYYHIPPHPENYQRVFQLYNEERDTWFSLTFKDILRYCRTDAADDVADDNTIPGMHNSRRILEAYQALEHHHYNSKRGAVPLRAQAPRLGTAISSTAEHVHFSNEITRFFNAVHKRELDNKDYYWNPQFLFNNLVFAMGTFDYYSTPASTLIPYNTPNSIPQVIRPSLNDAAGAISAWATLDPDIFTAFLIQSVQFYPRPIAPAMKFASDLNEVARQQRMAILAGGPLVLWNTLAAANGFDPANSIHEIYQHVSPYVAYGAATAPIGAGGMVALAVVNDDPIHNFDTYRIPNCRQFTQSFLLRNYNRYGIPVNSCTRAPQANGQDVTSVIDFNVPLTSNPFKQHLRPLGALYCPNHYKTEHPAAFQRIGNHLGYNIILTQNTLNELTTRMPVGSGGQFMDGTAIREILRTRQASANIIAYVKAILQLTVNGYNAMPPANRRSRWELTHHFLVAFGAYTPPVPPGGPAAGPPPTLPALLFAQFPQAAQNTTTGVFWTWPKTDRSEDDFVAGRHPRNANFSTWLNNRINTQANKEFLQVTNAMVNEFAHIGAHAGQPHESPFTTQVNLPPVVTITDNDAWEFLNMLAWRMFGDQEIPLRTDVDAPLGGAWPEITEALFPPQYHYAEFGHGLLPPKDPGDGLGGLNSVGNVEVIMVRPNIEHYMLGIILGQGGEGLGSTFWGQTELSCFDDSMHGIWGMSYKYHERAIVINERNLVRLWDIAYDSYIGGKNDTFVDWMDARSVEEFGVATNDVTKHYRGPSIMAMGFHHGESTQAQHRDKYAQYLKPNMPSPLVFCDSLGPDARDLIVDPENAYKVNSQEFRVFHRNIYSNGYKNYKRHMPEFTNLHTIRKNAGASTNENEASTDSLAFQGSMKVLGPTGARIWEVEGSGHHGPDYTGVASLRSGKGYKINSQPSIQRLV